MSLKGLFEIDPITTKAGKAYPNTTIVTMGELTIFVSYKTPIAYQYGGQLVIRQNDWGKTTGRHLNAIDTETPRIDGVTFEKQLAEILRGDA